MSSGICVQDGKPCEPLSLNDFGITEGTLFYERRVKDAKRNIKVYHDIKESLKRDEQKEWVQLVKQTTCQRHNDPKNVAKINCIFIWALHGLHPNVPAGFLSRPSRVNPLSSIASTGSADNPTVGYILQALHETTTASSPGAKRKAQDSATERIERHIKMRHSVDDVDTADIFNMVSAWEQNKSTKKLAQYLRNKGKIGPSQVDPQAATDKLVGKTPRTETKTSEEANNRNHYQAFDEGITSLRDEIRELKERLDTQAETLATLAHAISRLILKNRDLDLESPSDL